MKRNKAIHWLYGELPVLESSGILTSEVAQRLREYYGPVTIRSRRQTAMLLLGVLGALLIGLGIILLLAHNWNDLPRSVRTWLSFAPLVAGQVLAGWTLLRRPDSPAWRESTGLFLALAIGASISLVSQTYHIPGDMPAFLLTWVVLAAPLIYLLRATTVALLYLAGITWWTGAARFEGGPTLLFWPLAAFLVPYVWMVYQSNPEGPRMRLLSWAICAALPIALGLVLRHNLPGTWILAYSGLVSALLLWGRHPLKHHRNRAFYVAGFIGLIAVALILTFKDVWRHIGWDYYRGGDWVDLQDYVVAAACLAAGILPAVRGARQGDWFAAMLGGLPVLALLGFVTSSLDFSPYLATAMLNAYLLALGLILLSKGLAGDKLLPVNIGMVILSLLIGVRFFDAQISFTLRGILFILLGAAFLGVNVMLARHAAARKGTSL